MSLNTQSPVPLYRQLAQRLRANIERGELAVSQKIPSENELASEYGIGRPTVRQATDLLVREGILQRRRGAGTFVLPPGAGAD
jgi:GntR family transcriptional regulator